MTARTFNPIPKSHLTKSDLLDLIDSLSNILNDSRVTEIDLPFLGQLRTTLGQTMEDILRTLPPLDPDKGYTIP
jgi:hypothetical protein